MQSQNIVVTRTEGPGLLIRALYFVLFGLWFSGVWAAIAWFLCVTIIGLPLGLFMLNRLPQIVTLRPRQRDLVVTATGRFVSVDVTQNPFLLRALYFVLVGWWLSALWIGLAWLLCASLIGLPFGFWMFNRTATIVSLAR
jgi:uncharacterized membrane protein YccF (DUF307 family)